MSHRKQVFFVGVIFFLLGCLVAPQLPFAHAQDKGVKGPKWTHALKLKARKSTEEDFTKDTKEVGIEVFRDENNNNLIYITQDGYISVVPGK
jgi:hypothetical protein